jgi:hypothetical protein
MERVRVRRLVGVLALVLTTASCASLALSTGSELHQAAEKVYSQVNTAVLITEAAGRQRPASTALAVMLDDARSTLSDQESTILGQSRTEPHRDDVLTVTRRAIALADEVRAAIENDDRQGLHHLRDRLRSLATMLEGWGMA